MARPSLGIRGLVSRHPRRRPGPEPANHRARIPGQHRLHLLSVKRQPAGDEGGNLPVGPAKPAKAFGGAKVQFLLSELGFLIELIEAPNHRHTFRPGV